MKNNQLTSMLLGLLFLTSAGSAVLIYQYNASIHTLTRLRDPLAQASSIQNIMHAVYTDSVEYSKKNPAIIPVLQSLATKSTPAPAK